MTTGHVEFEKERDFKLSGTFDFFAETLRFLAVDFGGAVPCFSKPKWITHLNPHMQQEYPKLKYVCVICVGEGTKTATVAPRPAVYPSKLNIFGTIW
jgi:hypothetical protein